MNADNQILKQNQHTEDEKLKAAYALNMCTVSVSQIVDYNDVYILEQEYDAILNNLNLKQMPKDEALLKIISELLNTITFFRIQEMKKAQIEKKYQQRLKNAIWSAVPNLSVVVSGNPVAIALSLATQIGSGYMNYRKEKVNAVSEKGDAEIELQITAIEQLNALRRELFTTAWRLAEEYDFDDELRLTEKQIKQYNEILRDPDEHRKYARLEAVANKFYAYPPFWYFYGHTANYIAEMARNELIRSRQETEEERTAYFKTAALEKTYTELAKSHYEHYYSMCDNNLLREDQLTASFALEYVDILWKEESKDLEKIHELLCLAERMAPTSFDILQLCAISYLKIGESDDAARLFKFLVNEGYNSTANAKLLSKLYVSKYIITGDTRAISDYKMLEERIDPLYLYPMPKSLVTTEKSAKLDSSFMGTQKAILKKAYRNSLDAYSKKNIVAFNAILPPARKSIDDRASYYSYSNAAKSRRIADASSVFESQTAKSFVHRLKECGFRTGYIDILNQTISGIETLSCFRALKTHDNLIKIVDARIRNARKPLAELQEKLDAGQFTFSDYKTLVNNFSYQYFTENFFDAVKKKISDEIESAASMAELDTYDLELFDFCNRYKLPSPEEYLHMFRGYERPHSSPAEQVFFSGELIGIESDECEYCADTLKEMLEIVKRDIDGLVRNSEHVSIHLLGESSFETYFQNENLRILTGSVYLQKQKAFAIIDDTTKKDFDLILCVDGVTPVSKNTIRDTVDYGAVVYSANGNKTELRLDYPDIYASKDIDISVLKGIIDKLKEYLHGVN